MLKIKENLEIAPKTSFKIGGPVRYFVTIENLEEIPELFKQIKKSGRPFVVVGSLTNVLVSSKGYDGWMVNLGIRKIKQKKNKFYASAGSFLRELILFSQKAGYQGLQKLIGIPGTIGGAVKGNAGAWGSCMADVLEKVAVYDLSSNSFREIEGEKMNFNYHESILTRNKKLIVLGAWFSLKKAQKEILKKELKEIIKKRNEKVYSKYPSAGSVFRNIPFQEIKIKAITQDFLRDHRIKNKKEKNKQLLEFIPAGYLIEKVGLKGKRQGDAQISSEHGNVIINLDKATSEQVKKLIVLAKNKVRSKFKIKLQEEIIYIG